MSQKKFKQYIIKNVEYTCFVIQFVNAAPLLRPVFNQLFFRIQRIINMKSPGHWIDLSENPLVRTRRNYQKHKLIFENVKTENSESELDTLSIDKLTDKPSNVDIDMLNGHSISLKKNVPKQNRKNKQTLTEYFKEEKLSPSKNSPPIAKKGNVRSNKKVLNGNSSHKLTEYYPVRRSVRKTSKCVLAEKMRDLEKAIREQREDGLQIAYFDGKGRGVIATKPFCRGQFVVEYAGELVGMVEAKERELRYAKDPEAGCYMYYFRHGEQQYCMDATKESGRLGRLVNHSRNGNLVTKTVWVEGPRLVLLAAQDIEPGEELTYDYGDRSKESLRHHPWLAL